MLIYSNSIPEKRAFRRNGSRIRVLEEFMSANQSCAEYAPEADDNARRAYNGLLIAAKRLYAGEVSVAWRHGRVFLVRNDASADRD